LRPDPIIRYCPYCGQPVVYKFAFGADRPICTSCNWIHFTDPKVAVAILVKKNNQVLLTRRIFPPHKGSWTLPAGFVDAHEDPAIAAAREVLEETGLQVRITRLIDVLAGREHERGSDILIAYQAEITGGTLKAGDDADDANFFPIDQLPPLAFQTTAQILGQKIK